MGLFANVKHSYCVNFEKVSINGFLPALNKIDGYFINFEQVKIDG